MSAARSTIDEPNYYNRAALRAQEEAAKAAANNKRIYGQTARLRGDNPADFDASPAANPILRKEYLDNQTVERATIRKMNSDRDEAFRVLQRSVPKAIGDQFKIGEDVPTIIQVRVRDEKTDEVRVVKLRHLSTTVLGRMVHIAEDGSKSAINFYMANFTPGNVDPNGHRLEQIPPQHDGVKNKAITYMIGRKINPDGSLGEIDPRYVTEDGKAIMTRDLSEIRDKMIEIGTNNLAVIQRRNAETAIPRRDMPVTAQFGSQADRDAFRAHQARLRAQEDGRNFSRDQEPDAGRTFGR